MSDSNKNSQVTDRQRELTELLRKASDAYYNDDIEIMSNYEYDALFDELAALEAESGESLPGSVVSNVGSEVDAGRVDALRKVRHETPMLSLGKTKDRESLVGWLGGHEGCLSWKLDGSTLALTYEGGRLLQAVTRGNGQVGEDITAQAKRFKGVPARIAHEGRMVVRGEALMTYAEFERINALQPETARYKNPRNLASGTMRQLDLSVLDERTVEFHPFELVDAEGIDENSFCARLDLLATLGFQPVAHWRVDASTVVAKVDGLEGEVAANPFPSDGLVLQHDDVAYGRSLGLTGHHPRCGIALKWADETYETTLRRIDWYGSRTGRLNPVAVFDPVDMDGVTVTRASLHNITYVEDLRLGIGDAVTVYRANLVIPQISENLTRSLADVGDILPKACPICGGPVALHRDHDSDVLYCENPDCAAKSIKRLSHLASRDALDIRGLSDERIESLVDAGVVSSFVDILDLPSKREQVVGKVDRWGDRSFDMVAQAVEAARHTEARRALYAFGIREVGRSASRDICRTFGNDVGKVIDAAVAGDEAAFTAVENVGPIMARELISYARANEQLMRDVIARLDITDEGDVPQAAADGFVAGKTFVITGSVHVFANRNAFKAFVESQGGKVSGSVSKVTDYLVTNTPDSGTGKNKKARELGTAIITEDQFCEMAGYGA